MLSGNAVGIRHADKKENREIDSFFSAKKGDFQNGTTTDFGKKAEGNGEGEESQRRACKGSA